MKRRNKTHRPLVATEDNLLEYAMSSMSWFENFLGNRDLFTDITIYPNQDVLSKISMAKISFKRIKGSINISDKNFKDEIMELLKEDRFQKDIFFKKRLNYYNGDDAVYVIRPNISRFWTKETGRNDAIEITIEILNMSDTNETHSRNLIP